MIKPVSGIKTNNIMPPVKETNNTIKNSVSNSFAFNYADSFVKHSVESAPLLTGLTVVWAMLDKSQGIPFKKAFTNNLKTFLLPVMLVTSAITAFLENKKTNKQENK